MKKTPTYPHTGKSLQTALFILIFLCMYPNVFSQKYFQQKVNYTIQVTLNDKNHEISAFEKVEYINNSPDTLRFLYFHLWPNAYSGNQTDLAKQLTNSKGKERLFRDPELRGYIDSLNFKVDNQQVNWECLPGQPDICKINLIKPLSPCKSIIITTPFRVKIPKGVTSRMGHIGQSYQISQWFPKPAVYDRTGWHQMPYLDQGEFYAEFGKFDVSITLPENYIVGTSGDLQNKQELIKLDKLAADTSWIQNSVTGKVDFPASSEQLKTLCYTGNNMHDFAWFADKRFHVLKGKVILPGSKKEVTTWLMFTNQQSELWKNAIPYINHSVLDFSKWIGDYPYNSFTAVQSALNAGEGMEYPGITVIGVTKDAYSLDKVIAHEACHNWFYGALGSDERRYPFMDEGITTAYEVRYLTGRYPDKKMWEFILTNEKQAKFFHVSQIPAKRMMDLEWLAGARNNEEQPANLSSTDYTVANYTLIPYDKTAISFNYLRAYLGDILFDNIIQDYYHSWKFKHPQPDDLRKVVESHTNKNLSWFFDDLLGTTKRLDYKIKKYSNHQLLVQNVGELASPVLIAGMVNDSIRFSEWVDGFHGQKWIDIPEGNFTEFKIDPGYIMPEMDRLNNNIRTTGIFPKADPVQPQLLLSVEDPAKHALMYIPALNWNSENGLMVGMAIHNGFIIPKPVEYLVMPFYSFKNTKLAGYGKITWNITPYNQLIRLAKVSVEGTQFGAPCNQDYQKVMAAVDIYFRAKKMTNPVRQSIYGRYMLASDLHHIENFEKAKLNSYIQLGYNLQKASMVNPYNLLVSFESGTAYQKAAIDFKYKLSYTGKNNGLEVRLFAGTMLKNTSYSYYSLAASGRSGRELYLYDGTYPERFSTYSSNLFSRQMTLSEGGLVSPVNDKLGYSNWLLSLSLSTNLPGKIGRIGVKPFFNIVVNDHGLSPIYRYPVFSEAGIKVGIWNLFEIHIPLLVSNNIQSITGSISNRIRIVFNLNFSGQGKIGTGVGN